MEGIGGRPRSASSASERTSENLEDDDDYLSSDDDELYLEPGEAYGAFLEAADEPYDRRERVEALNKRLRETEPPVRKLPERVRINEDLNQYFVESVSDSENREEDWMYMRTSRSEGQSGSPGSRGERQRASGSEGQSRTNSNHARRQSDYNNTRKQ